MFLLQKNITGFFKNHRLIFVLFIGSQIVSLLSIMIIYGVNSVPQKMDEDYESGIRSFQITLDAYDADLPVKLQETYQNYGRQLRSLSVVLSLEGQEVRAEYFRSGYKAAYVSFGAYLSDAEFAAGTKTAVVDNSISFGEQDTRVGDTAVLFGEEFTIVGISREDGFDVPFAAVPAAQYANITHIELQSEAVPSGREAEAWQQGLLAIFGDGAMVQLPESRDLNILSRNTLQALMSAAIALLAVVNIAYLFRYVLEQRRRTFGVSMLCGCSRKRASRLLLGETVLYLFLCFGVCVPVFHWGLSPWFLELSGYRFSLDAVDYGILFVVYTAASLLVLYSVIRKYSRTSIRQQLQGG